ncbi:MAG: energy-coupling factor ABC transporter permease [Candidatus Asgardarchaeia archaeon]
MAHIHLPDGVIPLEYAALGWIASLTILSYSAYKFGKKFEDIDKVKLSIISAVIFVSSNIPIVGEAHLSLMPFAGIILGPYGSIIAAFIVNLFLAFIGHGGISVVGWNSLINGGLEALMASLIFHILRNKMDTRYSAFISTIIPLLISTVVVASFLSVMGLGPFEEFIYVIGTMNAIVAVIESIATAEIVRYIENVRPDMIA